MAFGYIKVQGNEQGGYCRGPNEKQVLRQGHSKMRPGSWCILKAEMTGVADTLHWWEAEAKFLARNSKTNKKFLNLECPREEINRGTLLRLWRRRDVPKNKQEEVN